MRLRQKPKALGLPTEIIGLQTLLGTEMVDRLLQALVPSLWHGYAQADARLRDVLLRETAPMAISVDRRRLEQTANLLQGYKAARIEPFAPVVVRGNGRKAWHLLLPPVLECPVGKRGPSDRMYVLDGTHRLYSSRRCGMGRIKALVVSSPHLPPPAAYPPDTWRQVSRVEPGHARGEARLCDYREPLFRPIAKTLDQDEWFFPTLGDCYTRAARIIEAWLAGGKEPGAVRADR
jgi:hypothetical protein